jgi:hypothetical protein
MNKAGTVPGPRTAALSKYQCSQLVGKETNLIPLTAR